MVNYDNMKRRAEDMQLNFAIVSRKMGKSRSWLNTARGKKQNIPSNLLNEIARILDTTPEYLRGETDDPNAKKDPQSSKDAGLSVDLEIMLKYALRHTFATNAIRAGVDMRTLAELLGHSDVAFTMQVYGHSDVALKVDAMKRIHNIAKPAKDKNTANDGENV